MLTVSRQILEKDLQKYFSHITQTGETVIITDNDIPFLTLTPFKTKPDVDDILKPETEGYGRGCTISMREGNPTYL